MREGNTFIQFMISDEDKEKLKERMKAAGMVNMSAYIRKMALNGYVIVLDLSDVHELLRQSDLASGIAGLERVCVVSVNSGFRRHEFRFSRNVHFSGFSRFGFFRFRFFYSRLRLFDCRGWLFFN